MLDPGIDVLHKTRTTHANYYFSPEKSIHVTTTYIDAVKVMTGRVLNSGIAGRKVETKGFTEKETAEFTEIIGEANPRIRSIRLAGFQAKHTPGMKKP